MTDKLLKETLNAAIRLRTCPPISVLRTQGGKCARHLQNCPACQEVLESSDGVNIEEFRQLEKSAPKAGDICQIMSPLPPSEYFDDNGVYFNPPHVLALEEDDGSGLVRVAQLFTKGALASQGDLLLDPNIGYYAQCWNVYGMHTRHLSTPIAHVDPELARIVLQKSHDSFLPVAVNGPLWQFRQCELATGSFFALPSVSYALGLLEERQMSQNHDDWLQKQRGRDMEEITYLYAASDGSREFQDKRTKSSAIVHGSKLEVKSRNSRPLGFVVLDASGKPLRLMHKGIGKKLEATVFAEAAINDDSAHMLILEPNCGRAKLRIPANTPPSPQFALSLLKISTISRVMA